MVMGDSGIFGKANSASEKTKQSQALEDIKLKVLEVQTENDGTATLAQVVEKLRNSSDTYKVETKTQTGKLSDDSVVANIENATSILVTNKNYGYEVEVTKDLSINLTGTNTGSGSGTGESGSGSGSGTGSDAPVNIEKIEFCGEEIPSPYSGNGTASNPYIIDSEAKLRFLAASVNIGLNTYEGKYIKLNNDITLDTTKQWTPIGNGTTRLNTNFNDTTFFEGNFDGNKKTISGINVNTDLYSQGLFGIIGSKGTVSNLIVSGSIVSSKDCVGGIAGVNFGKIQNCGNNASLSGTNSIGGIAGINVGIIKKCFNKGTVYASAYGAGGITGYNGNGDVQETGVFGINSYVYNSYNSGKITSGHTWGLGRSCRI